MKRLFHTIATLFFILAIILANPNTVLASEGDGEQALALEVNGYHVTISSQGEWAKGENTIVVTITDGMGIPIRNAEVEILIASNADGHAEADGHGEPEVDEHTATESNEHIEVDPHESEQEHDSVSGTHGEASTPTSNEPVHEEEKAGPIPMVESEHGRYIAEAHLASTGQHEIQVMFHADGEMLQANFIVEVPGLALRPIVLWSFVVVNVGLVVSAGILKKQAVPVKGDK